jgi:hypothetical protein
LYGYFWMSITRPIPVDWFFHLFKLTKFTALLLLPQNLLTSSDLGITSSDVTQWREILEKELANGEDFILSRT